ncbi:MAG: amidohydrolase family protein [Rhodospirillaceae bacterium]|jgi:predicted TIM-barrel fold metal-dependent hydrolase|nr:amidohydrolase family protein [Rhodospirillales bacterium]MBT4703569.1 amidohydrolase family protein [Rhodospirillaceae bacterium]MBT6220224.1 amidohydrolase family protein [Rhodospirillaceae bacterium]MBT6363478.1 amidohydrolase family protein [Rhodospirillaceae bacterium]MBT7768536.1 amidohydrolase family protein [Rhodospirillales bacterium]
MAIDKKLAADCHIHIVADQSEFPLAEHRSYTIPPARVETYWATMSETDVGRVVVVQPSCYGKDNRCLLDALESFGDRARGVAVVDPENLDDQLLSDLHDNGVRGVRVNLLSVRDQARPMETVLPEIDAALAGSNWHIQVFCAAETLPALAKLQEKVQAPLVIDHFGFVRPENLERDFPNLFRLLENGAWVKLSGTDRVANGPDSPGLGDLARKIFAAFPDNAVWGSDWPHTPMHSGGSVSDDVVLPYREIDTAGFFKGASEWFPEGSDCHKLFVSNPARLYDWPMDGN